MAVQFFVGTSGWHYEHWASLFYPQGLSKSKWLSYYCQHFTTVELNNSFYRLPSEAAFERWRESAPSGFVFSVKVSRLITYLKKLKNVEEPLKVFLNRARLLGNKLGSLLYQLPPQLHRNDQVLEEFLRLLPRDMRHTFEFRHDSWLTEEVFQILRRYNVALCLLDMPGLSTPLIATADFTYMRFHGSTDLYASQYSDEQLWWWGRKLAELSGGLKALYGYFNNDAQAYAIGNALTLKNIVK